MMRAVKVYFNRPIHERDVQAFLNGEFAPGDVDLIRCESDAFGFYAVLRVTDPHITNDVLALLGNRQIKTTDVVDLKNFHEEDEDDKKDPEEDKDPDEKKNENDDKDGDDKEEPDKKEEGEDKDEPKDDDPEGDGDKDSKKESEEDDDEEDPEDAEEDEDSDKGEEKKESLLIVSESDFRVPGTPFIVEKGEKIRIRSARK